MNDAHVLDASALLCLLKAERGADRVAEVLARATISAVNVSEVYAKLADVGGSEEQIARAVGTLHLKVEPFDDVQARIAGMLRATTRPFGLSLGDRGVPGAGAPPERDRGTTDRAWLDLPAELGLRVLAVR